MNLLSTSDRWLSLTPEKLIDAAQKNQNFNLAERTVEAVSPSLMKVSEGYLSELDHIEVFLYLAYDADSKQTLASIVTLSESDDGKFKPLHSCKNEQADKLATSGAMMS